MKVPATEGANAARRPRQRARRRLCLSLGGTASPLPLLTVLAGMALCGEMAERTRRPGAPHNTPYDRDIRRAARQHMPDGWDWRIFKAMIQQESQFDPHALSRAGARGLGQIMPATAGDLGVALHDLDNPEVNINASAQYLRYAWERWDGLPDRAPLWTRSRFAIASYNAGPARVRRAYAKVGRRGGWTAVKPHLPLETQRHIDKIFDEYYPAMRKLHVGSAGAVHSTTASRRIPW